MLHNDLLLLFLALLAFPRLQTPSPKTSPKTEPRTEHTALSVSVVIENKGKRMRG